MTLMVLYCICQIFFRVSIYWKLADAPELWTGRQQLSAIFVTVHSIKMTCLCAFCHNDSAQDILSSFLYCKFSLSSFHLYSLGMNHHLWFTLKNWELGFCPLGGEYLHKLFVILWKICFFSFFCLLICGYLFCNLVYFIAQTVLAWAVGNSLRLPDPLAKFYNWLLIL